MSYHRLCLCILVSLGILGFYEFASQVYRIGCTEWNGTGFEGFN